MNPENWPESFTYSPASSYLGFVSHLLFSHAAEDLAQNEPLIAEKRVHPHLKIQILDSNHPIAGQRGIFAREKIAPFTTLGEYVGEVFMGSGDPEMFPRKDVHCWFFKRNGIPIQISSYRVANELAFVNDYRGIKPVPNTGLQWAIHKGCCHLMYVTLQEIAAGEELLVDYGRKWAESVQKQAKTPKNDLNS